MPGPESLPMQGELILKSAANDTGEVYQYRAKKLASSSRNWLELFAYMVFGPQFIGSLALALDPYSKVRFPSAKITSVNRTRRPVTITRKTRNLSEYRVYHRWYNDPLASECSIIARTPIIDTTVTDSQFTAGRATQAAIRGLISDTTVRTRGLGSTQGEFELFIPYASSGGRTNSWFIENRSATYFGKPCETQEANNRATRYIRMDGPQFPVFQTDYDAFLAEERANATVKFQKHYMSMLSNCLPSARKFPLAYNVAELKDLPMTLRKTVELFYYTQPSKIFPFSVKGRRKDFGIKDAGDQYLNWKFGWESTMRSVNEMLELPTIIAKHVNYLISRRGLPTTFRTRRTLAESIASQPFLLTELGTGESIVSSGFSSKREIELRMMLNLTLDFPDVAVPVLRKQMLLEKWGVLPTPADVYNIVPWTWLVDWFAGIGEYVDVIDTIRADDSLFNYGFITYCSRGNVTKNVRIRTTSTTNVTYNGSSSGSSTQLEVKVANQSSTLGYRYQKRIDISSLPRVKTISRPTTLSTDQQAIIGALLSKWAKN